MALGSTSRLHQTTQNLVEDKGKSLSARWRCWAKPALGGLREKARDQQEDSVEMVCRNNATKKGFIPELGIKP